MENSDTGPRKVIPITFKYVDFSSGQPREVEEERHLYYTMGAVKKLMDQFGVDQAAAQDAVQDASSPEEAQEELDNILAQTEIEMSEQEGIITMVWAGLLPEAQARGEELTVEQVGNMIDLERVEEITEAVQEAWEYFNTGEEGEATPTPDSSEKDGEEPQKKATTTKSPR
jgi:hypothetical protein